MTHRKLLALLLALLTLLLVACDHAEEPPEGDPAVTRVDGLLQNENIYITNARYEEGYVHYELVNETDFGFTYAKSTKPYVQKKIDGEWQRFTLWTEEDGPYSQATVEPHSRHVLKVGVTAFAAQRSGEYRMAIGTVGHTEQGPVLLEDQIYVVGYFTIT